MSSNQYGKSAASVDLEFDVTILSFDAGALVALQICAVSGYVSMLLLLAAAHPGKTSDLLKALERCFYQPLVLMFCLGHMPLGVPCSDTLTAVMLFLSPGGNRWTPGNPSSGRHHPRRGVCIYLPRSCSRIIHCNSYHPWHTCS